MRGVWLATVWGIDWPSVSGDGQKIRQRQMDELRTLLDCCESANLTSVFFQVRGMADAMYESSLEPWSAALSGKRGVSPGWDPLAFAVEECHRRGLECYAWVNPFRWSSGSEYDCVQDREWKNKGWLLSYGKYTVFNPGSEDVRRHIVDVCREIIDSYDVDGLVFDDYFYPNKIPEDEGAGDYTLWQKEASWMSFGDWRRANVHKTVADVYAMVCEIRPDIRFGISPAGVAGKLETSAIKWGMEACGVKADDWQYDEIYSDPLGWLYQRTVDFISPQIYWTSDHPTAPYGPLSLWWSEAANFYGCHFYSSVTLAALDKRNTDEVRAELLSQVDCNRANSIDGDQGSVFYSAKHFHKLSPELSGTRFKGKCITPEVKPRTKGEIVYPPSGLVYNRGRLHWKSSSGNSDTRGMRYVVYVFPSGMPLEDIMEDNGDGIKSEYIFRVCYDRQTNVPESGFSYAVTSLTGLSVESAPVFLHR